MTESHGKFTDREAAAIIRLASQLEEQADRESLDRAAGFTLGDLEELAVASAIAPDALRAALDAWEASPEGSLASLVGGPTLFRVERTVLRSISDEEFSDLAESMSWLTGNEGGSIERSASGFTWRHATDEGPSTTIDVHRIAGVTRMRILSDHLNPAGWSLIGAGVMGTAVAGVAIAALEPSLAAGFGIVTASLGSALFGARAFWRGAAKRTRRRLASVADRIEEYIARKPSISTSEPPAPSS